MLDWTAFEAACGARERPAVLAAACADVWSWLVLDGDDATPLFEQAIANADSAHIMSQALDIVGRRVRRDAASGALTAGDAVARADAVRAMQQVVADRLATVAASEDEDRARLLTVTGEVSAALERAGGPFVDAAACDDLSRVAGVLAAAGESFGPVVAREHAWWMGLAQWGLASAAQTLGRFEAAYEAFEESARHYEDAGAAESAASSRAAAAALTHRLRGDVDAASMPDVLALLSDLPGVDRAGALARLSRQAGGTGDRFGAARLGEQVAAVLADEGYADPQPDIEAACQSWLDTAATGRHGADPFKRLCEVVEQWAIVLSTRLSERPGADDPGLRAAQHAFEAITTTFLAELTEHAESARRAATERLAEWDPDVAIAPDGPRAIDAAAGDEAPAAAADTAAMLAINDALYALRVACNNDPQPALLDEADRLLAQAEAMGSRVHAASALAERAYILGALGRHDDVPAAADAAIERLLDGRPATLGSFTTGFERDLYLMAASYKARAAAARRDHAGILAACLPVVRDIEAERRRVNAPYQQSASLGSRTEFYEMVAVAAWRTDDGDLLLDTTERLKARASLASRSRRDDTDVRSPELTEALREWRSVNEALRSVPPSSPEATRLRERRQWLSTVVAIGRAADAGIPDTLAVADIQAVLADDEAAISWFWLGADALIVQAFTHEAREAVVFPVEASAAGRLEEFVAMVTTLDEHSDLDRFEWLVDALGGVLVPERIRAAIAGCRRLVLCPHRTLHLFPMHAIPWPSAGDAGRLAQQVAVRYVPNLTSLLLPWQGTTQGPVLAVGVSEFEHLPDDSLPAAEEEAEAVAAVHGALGEYLPRPTREAFVERIAGGGYRCLHLATHGSSVLTGDAVDDPREAALSLCDGDLSAWDLAALEMRAELVSLAACNSSQRAVAGRGLASLPGDDLFGLQAVLFEAGAWSVLGALWPVGDDTSLEMMQAVHMAYAQGASPDVALHEATRAYLAAPGRVPHVCDWAPFVLTTLGRREVQLPASSVVST